MFVRYALIVAACGASASSALADLTELSMFRQVATRARFGGFSPAPAEIVTNSSAGYTLYGPFVEDRTSISPDTNHSSLAHSTQNTHVGNGYYFGSLHANTSAIGNPSGTSDAGSNYGTSPNNFQTTFSVAFTVTEPTMGRIFGTVSTSRTSSASTNAPALFLIGDILLPGTPQPALLSVQPTAAGSPVSFDQMFTFIPGHRYSITASINLSSALTGQSGSTSASSDINFTALIPAPGTGVLLGGAGLLAMRRRRR